MNVSELMTAPAHTCRPADSLAIAARIMWENDFGVVAVLDDSNRLVASVTDRDLCMAAYTRGRALDELRVRDCMSGEVVTCKMKDTVGTALETMARARVRRLPVVDDQGHLAGMLSMADVARSFAEDSRMTPEVARQLLRTLVAVSTPHGREPAEPVVELEPATGSPEAGRVRAVKKTSTRKKNGR